MEKDQNLAIFNKFKFEKKPIGIKFFFNRPNDIEHLGKQITLCELIKEAQILESGILYNKRGPTL